MVKWYHTCLPSKWLGFDSRWMQSHLLAFLCPSSFLITYATMDLWIYCFFRPPSSTHTLTHPRTRLIFRGEVALAGWICGAPRSLDPASQSLVAGTSDLPPYALPVYAANTYAASERSWLDGFTSSCPAMQRLGRICMTRYTGSTQTVAGGATSASASPGSPSSPGAPCGRGQARVLWKRIARMCKWERPRAPAVGLIDDVRAAPVLTFLRDTRVGRMVPLALREEWRGEDIGREAEREGGEGGPRPP